MTRQTEAVRSARPVPAIPRPAPLRTFLIERVFRLAVAGLAITVAFPGGERVGRGGRDAPVMRIVRPDRLFRRLAVTGPIGFGEAYMAGDWTSTDPAGLLTAFAARLNRPANRTLAKFRRLLDQTRPESEHNTPDGARSNIERHYDLSDDLFALFLDDTLTYSCALFAPGDDLRTAQERKMDSILADADVGEGTRVLEIGTGWGALAVRAARLGAHVTTLTLSGNQSARARTLAAEAGLSDQVEILLDDYRNAEGRYDAVVSVEMIEAVGLRYLPSYFATISRTLAPGGRVALQTITMPHDRMLATRDVHTWIQKYVFPGGQIPSVRAVETAAEEAGLRVTGRRSLTPHYATTLRLWRERFLARADEAEALGFDLTFRRMWEFYLAYSEAGFRSGYLDVWQFRLER